MEIVTIPQKILRAAMPDVPDDWFGSGRLAQLIIDMRAAMLAANGVGLAANQVGHQLRLFVIDAELAKEHGIPDAFANPEITEYSKETDVIEEGCLSIPGTYMPIFRSKKVMFKGYGADGKKYKFRARGFLARVLQHETDHLNGTVIADRAKEQKKTS
ncbi:MAG: peptide deformylase [Candidatus Paceibacterota bacterium]|nr:MAG: peptide deformylase [Candidatus Paceibacterota bacterium]